MMRIGPQAAGTSGAGAVSDPDHATLRGSYRPSEDDIGHAGGERRDALGSDLQSDLREKGRHLGNHAQEAASRNAFEQSLKRALKENGAEAEAKFGTKDFGAKDMGAKDMGTEEFGETGSSAKQIGRKEAGPQDVHAKGAAAKDVDSLASSAMSHARANDQEPNQSGSVGRRQQNEDLTTSVDAATLKLLAFAERAPGFALAPSAPPTAVASVGTEQAIRISALTQRVEEAIRAELYATPGQPIALKIDLTDLIPGLNSVTVSMTPEGIDVTLARTVGEASAELLQAAQALADRLQTRFAKRVVRVLDAPVLALSGQPVAAGGTQATPGAHIHDDRHISDLTMPTPERPA